MPRITRDALAALDAADTLAPFRDRFILPERVIYLDGNSLGAMPKAARERVRRELDESWGRELIRAWNSAGWIDLPARVGDRIGAEDRPANHRRRGHCPGAVGHAQ